MPSELSLGNSQYINKKDRRSYPPRSWLSVVVVAGSFGIEGVAVYAATVAEAAAVVVEAIFVTEAGTGDSGAGGIGNVPEEVAGAEEESDDRVPLHKNPELRMAT